MQNPAALINQERIARGMSIKYLSDQTGVRYSVLQPSLTGRRELRVDEFFSLCKFLHMDPGVMLQE